MNPDLNPQHKNHSHKKTELFDQVSLIKPAKRGAWKIMLPLSLVLLAIVFAAWTLGWHAQAVTAGVLLLAALSHALAWLVGIIALVPIIGPLLVKVLSLSIIWLLNAIGYLVSYIAIRRGYAKDVLTYRAITIALISGIVIGFVLGSLL